MTRVLSGLLIGCLTAALSQQARAESYSRPAAPLTWHLAGGYSAPSGQISDYLQGGWAFNGGFTYTPNGSPLGLRGDVGYSAHNATNKFLDYGAAVNNVQVDSGTGTFFSVSLGPSYTVPFIGRSHLYGFAQIGLYRSSLQLTQTVLFAGNFCDPYFGFCESGLAVGDVVVYDDSRNRFGWNAGVGVMIQTRFGTTYFMEAGYHRLLGSQSLQYIPIEFGIRF